MLLHQELLRASLLIAFLSVAIWTDLRDHRISNRLIMAALASALVLQMIVNGSAGLTSGLGGAVVGFALLLPFYLLRGMGAADVKWMAAMGAFFDPATAALAAGLALLAGLILALGLLWCERVWPIDWIMITRNSGVGTRIARQRFPYAPAIAIGALTTLLLTSGG